MKKVVFLHIQKTGGNSMHQILFNNRRGYVSIDWHYGRYFGPAKLKRLQQKYPLKITGIGGHEIDCTQKDGYFGEDQFTFTFLRDPIARYLSFYNHMVNKKGFELTIDQFLDGSEFHHNMQTKSIAKSGDVKKAKAMLHSHFDFIGIHEEMDKSLKMLASRLQIDVDQKELNVSSSDKIKWEELSKEQQNKVLTNNVLDLELYKEAQQLFSSYSMAKTSAVKVSRLRKWMGVVLKKLSLQYVNRDRILG